MTRVSFGTDGVRGVAGTWPIVPEVAFRVGAAVASRASGARVVIGFDTRPSGPLLEESVIRGVLAAGGVPVRAGIVPTAALQVALAGDLAEVGVMITASHNPAADNGFKVLLAGGRKPDDEASAALEHQIAAAPATDPRPTRPLPTVDRAVTTAWLARLDAERWRLGSFVGRRIVLDLANGALAPHRATLEALLSGQLLFVGAGPGDINDGCGSEHLGLLQSQVVDLGADVGLAFDGDADRVRVVDERGIEVPGDAVTWLLAKQLEVPSVAVTVMSTTALEQGLPGVRVVRTAVGDRHVRDAMDREGIPLGAEDSGHVLFGDHPAGDGLFAGLRALAAAFARARSVSLAVRPFEVFPRRLTGVRVSHRVPIDALPGLAAATAAGEATLGAGGRVFVRYSGTEPVLRILVEGRDVDQVAAVSQAVTRAAQGGLG